MKWSRSWRRLQPSPAISYHNREAVCRRKLDPSNNTTRAPEATRLRFASSISLISAIALILDEKGVVLRVEPAKVPGYRILSESPHDQLRRAIL